MMKKSLLILLSALLLIGTTCFTACDSWMQDDDFYSDIENDVKVANAKQIQVYVRYAMTRQGKTDPDGYKTFKVEIPQTISATTETEFGFVRWAAFSTDFLATGDNQTKNKDVYFIDDEDYNTRLLPQEITAPSVVFEDATKPTTKVTINVKRNDIFLVPIVAQRPAVALTIPARGSQNVVRNMSVRISFTKAMDPESFKNSEGVFDTITVTQGTQTVTADGDIEINSQDITDHFENPVFSKNQKMITLQFKPEALDEGYASQSSVTITISKEVKDIYGFSMVDDEKVSFTAGSSMDTLAPRITLLTGGKDAEFAKFQGMYKDSGLIGNLGTNTKMRLEGAKNAPTDDVDAHFYDSLIANRVQKKVIIRTFAQDIAGSGEGLEDAELLETDVSLLAVRVKLLYNADGSEAADYAPVISSVGYVPQGNNTSLSGSYKDVVEFANEKDKLDNPQLSDQAFLNSRSGTLFEYDLSDETKFPDGLYQIDVAAVDLVGNSGFAAGGNYSDEYGNGYASLFIVKDTTPPDLLAAGNVEMFNKDNPSQAIDQSKYYNASDYAKIELAVKTTVTDKGHPRLRSPNSDVKWTVLPEEQTISITQADWKEAKPSERFDQLTPPSADKTQHFVYALIDDLGNYSKETLPESINYDCTTPALSELSWTTDNADVTPGIAKANELTTQTLVIPLREITSGLETIELTVTKDNTTDFGTPFAGSDLTVKAGNTKLDKTTDYTVSGNKLTFKTPQSGFDKNLTITGLKISDADNAAGREGRYVVKVKATDAAKNSSTTTASQNVVLSIDSTGPEIKKILFNNIRKSVALGSSSGADPVYWIDYTVLNTANTNPRTDIYIEINETNSGVKVFDFSDTSSTIRLTGDSKLYKADGTEITSKVENNKLTVKNKNDAVINTSGATSTVRISNVELRSATEAKLKLKLSDTAVNESIDKTLPENSTESYSRLTGKDGNTELANITSFKYSSTVPDTYNLVLKDRGYDDDAEGEHPTGDDWHVAALDGFTSEQYINANFYVNYTNTPPVYQLTIIGDAEFDDSAEANKKTTIKNVTDDKDLVKGTDYVLSDDKKTITFKKSSGEYLYFDSAKALQFNNLKLTSGDATKSVKIQPKTLSQVVPEDTDQNSNKIASKSIVLDTQAPEWNGKGFYSATDSEVNSSYVYPNPEASGSSASYGIEIENELYFYKRLSSTKIRINPDIKSSEKNFETIYWTDTKKATYSKDTYYGEYNACAVDKAGNKSSYKKLHIVNVSAVNTDTDLLEHNAVLSVPDGSNYTLEKNTFLNEVRCLSDERSTSYDFFGSPTSFKIYYFGYVLKGGAGNYQLKVPLSAYAEATKNFAAIEEYYISHNYRSFPSNTTDCNYDPYIPRNPGTNDWNEYKKNSNEVTDVDVTSKVNSDGDIIITLPSGNCPPLSLWLKDACGNTKYILLSPGLKDKIGTLTYCTNTDYRDSDNSEEREKYLKRNQAVGWVIDSSIIAPGSSATALSDKVTFDGVTYFKGAPYVLKTYDTSISCLYNSTSITTGDYSKYSIKATLYAGASAPSDSEIDAIPDADWVLNKATSQSATLSLNLPHPVNGPNKIWFIVEDRVGNRAMTQIKNGSITDWQYDADAPSMEVTPGTEKNINTIGDTNYWSDSLNDSSVNDSKVTYKITDAGSGIQYDGTETYTTRETSINKAETALKEFFKDPNTLEYNLPAVGKEQSITIAGAKDHLGNSSSSESLKIKTGEDANHQPIYASKWIRQTRPTVSTTASSTIEINNGNIDEAGQWTYGIWLNSQKSTADGAVHEITAASYLREIPITLKPTKGDGDTQTLLGWVRKSSPLTTEEKNHFYVENDSRLVRINNNVFTAESFKYIKYNDDPWEWNGQSDYWYPVNRAGLISDKAIIITFKQNEKPVINSVSYEGIPHYKTNNVEENFIKAGSKLNFTTNIDVSSCRVYYGSNTNDYAAFTLTGSSPYTIDLNVSGLHVSEKELRLVAFTGSDKSDEKQLTGNGNNNKWTYDNTAPGIVFGGDIQSYDSSNENDSLTLFKSSNNTTDTTKYLTKDHVKIPLTVGKNSDCSAAATDVVSYQWKVGDADWAEIPPENITKPENNSMAAYVRFAAPKKKTTYSFRVIDKAGNISLETADIVECKLQGDSQAPGYGETPTFKLSDGNNDDKQIAETLIVKDEANNKTSITYSSVSGQTNFINKIVIDFSNITDKIDGEERSGLRSWVIKHNGTNDSTPTSLTTKTVNLTGSLDGDTWEFIAEDWIGQSRTIRTFVFTADNSAPVMTLDSVKTYDSAAPDSKTTVTAVDKSDGNGPIYYLKNGKGQITFTIDDKDAVYTVSDGVTKSVTGNDTDGYKLVCTFDSPSSSVTELSFQGTDAVGNVSQVKKIKVIKDADAPTGNPGFSLKQSNGTSGVDVRYFTDSNASQPNGGEHTIVYNYATDKAYLLILDFSSIEDTVSGIKNIYKSENADGSSPAPITLTDGKYTINLANSDAANYADKDYVFTVEDNAGNTRELYKFKLQGDNTAPDLALSDESEGSLPPVQTKGTGSTSSTYKAYESGDVYYLKRDNAIINFKKSSTDIAKYQYWKTGYGDESDDSNWTTIDSTDTNLKVEDSKVSYLFAAPGPAENTNDPTTYKFRAVDKVGNVSAVSTVTLVKDTVKPGLPADKEIGISFAKGETPVASDAGFSIVTTDTTTTPPTVTISYNAHKINTVILDVSEIVDNAGGSGIASITSDNDITLTSNTFTFTAANTYTIKAKDHCDNEATIMKFVLKAFTGVTVEKTQNPPYSGLDYVPTYNPETGAARAKADANTRPQQGEPDYRIKAFAYHSGQYSMSNTSTEATDSANINIMTYGNSGNDNGWPTNKQDCGWNIRWLKDDADTTFTVPFKKSSLPSNKLYYALTYHSIVQPTEWTEVTDASAFTNGKFTVTIDKSKVLYRHTFMFIWYKDALGNITVYNLVCPENEKTNQNWWCPASKKDEAPTADDFAKFKYTSAETYMNTGTIGGIGAGAGGMSVIPNGTESGEEKGISRITQFFNNVQNAFTRSSEVAVEKPVTEKESKATKKTANKTSKKTKASKKSKKASQKQPAVELAEQTMAAITEQTVPVEAPKVDSAAEFVTNEIAAVSDAVSVTAGTSRVEASAETQTSVTAAAEEPQKKSSSTAVIVVMLAILASCAGAWYTLKARKRK